MMHTPERFRPHIRVDYPENNRIIFEEWFYSQVSPYTMTYTHPDRRVYLPIFWTSYWVNHNYGQSLSHKLDLQQYVDALPRDLRYFTIVQYDDGCLVDFKDLDIKVFNMSGEGYPMPLLCQPQPFKFDVKRDLLYSFVGSMTHDLRRSIPQTTQKRLEIKEYCELHARSIFSLCPRGYGINSFRIQEALQYGAIPVYISDKFVFPHNVPFDSYGVVIEAKDVHRIDEILKAIPEEEIKKKQELLPGIFQHYYTYEANKELILQNI